MSDPTQAFTGSDSTVAGSDPTGASNGPTDSSSDPTAPDGTQQPPRPLRGKLIAAGAIVLVLLLVAAWSGFTHWQLTRSASQFEAGEYAASEESARTFLRMSPFEKHKGHFAVGTALAADGDLDGGEAALLTSLSTSPECDECAVRINLALVQEEQGNTFRDADEVTAANERYDTAQQTLSDAPDECRQSGSGEDEQMTSQEERVGEAQDDMNNPSSEGEDDGGGDSGGGSSSGEGDDSGGDSRTGGSSGDDGEGSQGGSGGDTPGEGSSEEDPDERMEELEERRRESEERHSQTNGGGSGSGVREPGSKPW